MREGVGAAAGRLLAAALLAASAATHAAEQAQTSRDPVASLEARLAAQRAADERAEAARLAAAAERRRTEQAARAAEVAQVLDRARNDYPILRTPAGEPILRSIVARQQVLQAQGLYPSVAMVEAVADHAAALRPPPRAEPAPPAPPAAPDHSKSFGNCRWESSYTWSCK